ncbi:hypothetical protein F2Q68_00014554 [Brassica cretica]|uniref:Uncharacterized protein n=1 Tax=Brassica cretica TaxID=69181 RepID=A0A8S9HNX3_BRACR|nr:hypothetical protein F2Q68_00014554 [Brassica cretica]
MKLVGRALLDQEILTLVNTREPAKGQFTPGFKLQRVGIYLQGTEKDPITQGKKKEASLENV